MDTTIKSPYPYQWLYIHPLCNSKACCRICSWSQIRCTMLKLKRRKIIIIVLYELGHPQPPTPIHYNNSTAAVIVNGTVKLQCSKKHENSSFIHFWLSKKRVFTSTMAPWTRKPLWLRIKTSWCETSPKFQINIHAQGILPNSAIMGIKFWCSVEGCWNYTKRLRMWPPPPYVQRNCDVSSTGQNTVLLCPIVRTNVRLKGQNMGLIFQ